MKIKKYNYLIASFSGLILLGLDILTKYLVIQPFYKPVTFIKNFLYLTNVQKNSGIAFGIKLPIWLQIIGSIIILVLLFRFADQYFFSKNKRQFLKPILFGIIIGGAIGNLINRIFQGYVVDFIVLKPIPVFNIADIGITVGFIALLVLSLFGEKKL
ncbi:signal peptidase II [Candidatus Peregrinibacteria bacterium]|nr:signal peptidase II [Candidatus Peregrinibacteria bacterium]